ncbi:major facilitator superfamily domain-containing protein [Hypoxylon sp. FL0890]|nr:major facilitator superfamily domain-containing protein [Hypoxylon sp. FL0890]
MPKQPVLSRVRSEPWFTVAVVMVAAFTDTLFYGLFVPFTPIILQERADVSSDQLQMWNSVLLAVYGGAILIASPLFGYLADHGPSRQLAFLSGFGALTGATVMMHLGGTEYVLLAARVLQGMSAACVYSAGFAMLHDAFGAENIGYALGCISPALTTGAFLGPTLGGLLYDVGGEAAVFGCAYGVILLDILMRLAWIPPPSEKRPAALVNGHGNGYGTIQGPCPRVVEEGGDTFSSERPISFWLKISQLKGLIVPTSGWLVVGSLLTAFDGVLPLFVQGTFQWSVSASGLIFLLLFVPSTVVSPLCGAMCDRGSPRTSRFLAAAGFCLCVPSLAMLGIVKKDSIRDKVLLCVLLAVIGSGTALAGPPLMKQVAVVVEDTEQRSPGIFGPRGGSALAYGLHNSAFALGNLMGPMIAGAIMASFGWASMGWALAVISAVGMFLVLLFMGRGSTMARQENYNNGQGNI